MLYRIKLFILFCEKPESSDWATQIIKPIVKNVFCLSVFENHNTYFEFLLINNNLYCALEEGVE